MRLFIINGDNNSEKIEIDISEYEDIKDLREKLAGVLQRNDNSTRYSRFFRKKLMLMNCYSIKRYSLCENDEIWFGRVENYLKEDDVIIDVFIVGRLHGRIFLIMKRSDTISEIRSIMEQFIPKIINIWNREGKLMGNHQIVSDIDRSDEYYLIISYEDKEGEELNYSFDYCCNLHDRRCVDQYLYSDEIRDDNKNLLIRLQLMNISNDIKKNIDSYFNNTEIWRNENLSDLPFSYVKSRNIFCGDMTNRIMHICDGFWKLLNGFYEESVLNVFWGYLYYALYFAVDDYVESRQLSDNSTKKSISSIVVDSMNYFINYLIDSNNDWQYWQKIRMNKCLLKPFSDFQLKDRNDKFKINNFTINLKLNGVVSKKYISHKPDSIEAVKQIFSKIINVDAKHLYCINPGGDEKPNDQDPYDNKFIIEIVMDMNDIKILKCLGQGGFGEIFLCLNMISQQQFVMKKGISKDAQLYRDINIYSKLDSSKFIMNYSGLFRDDEGIGVGMQYMTGGTLCEYLKSVKQITEPEIIRISSQILLQIKELHEREIIHRDIKSDNIVFDDQGNAKLIDFGLSKYSDGLTNREMLERLKVYLPGTIYYMAPELIKEEPYSNKIDIWSFGMVMIEMVTGKRPFPGLNMYTVIDALRKCEKYKFKSAVPISNEFEEFINSCLNTNPDKRPSAQQLIYSVVLNC